MPVLALEEHFTDEDVARELRGDVAEGLRARPKTLPPKWLYDARGSDLFDKITELEEYYPTRAERDLLRSHAAEIGRASGADTLVELGSGSSEKTELLLSSLRDQSVLRRYVPVDVSASALIAAADRVDCAHPGLEIQPVCADFERHLHLLPHDGRRLVAFLGGTIGNFESHSRVGLLSSIRAGMTGGDALLLGADLVKDPRRLVAAYDDAGGVTAEFNRNVFWVLNRELGADFVPAAFEYVASWDAVNERVDMRQRSTRDQVVRLAELDMVVDFAAGEEIRTEVSSKFRRQQLAAELAEAGLALRRWWSDGDYALCLATPASFEEG